MIALRRALLDAREAALKSLHPARLVANALPEAPPPAGRVIVIAAGKAAPAMARGALDRWQDRIDEALVIGVAPMPASTDARVTMIAAAHPIPDERSVVAATEAIARASRLGPDDLLIALISGGASALMAAPLDGLDLLEKQAIVATLLERGTPIRDVNLVRRHLSRIKGGRLARAAMPAETWTLIVSDVIGGAAHDIGSGPSVPDPTTIDDARAVLDHAGIAAPLALAESLKPNDGARTRAWIIAEPASFGSAIAEDLARRWLHASVDDADEGDAIDIVERRLARAATLAPGQAAVIPCEPTVRLPRDRGRGGRAGDGSRSRRCDACPTTSCCSARPPTGSMAAPARPARSSRADASRIDPRAIDAAIAGFDDAAVHRAIGTQVPGGPTGHNLTDVHVIARLPR